MKTATSGFISAISDGCPYHTVKFYYNGTELDITPKTFNYYGLMIGGENINIGETCASHVEFEIYNPTVTLENKEIQVKVGIEVNGSIEYVSLGYFTVTKPSIESEVYKYIAYDRMIGLERLYVSSLTNPTTSTVMNEIATQLGYSFASTITEISLDINKIKGYTYREMLGFISALCGANCIFNGDGAIEFKWFVQPTSDLATIGTDRLYENGLELNSDEDITVGYIKCATGAKEEVPIEDTTTEDTTENTEITDGEITEDEVTEEPITETVDVILSVGSGNFGINISNPLMTQTVLENIYNTYFSNFTFRPCKVNMLGNILLECGDIVTVNNGTNTYTVPIMSIQHSIDGGVVTNIETIAQNETEQEISYTSPTVKLMDRVYYEILEANKAIINDLTANTVTTEYLKANYAQINLANIENGCITNAMIGTEAVKTSQIADGSITDAKIVELTANKIKAGTLDVERLIVTQNNQKYLFHINEDGTTEYQKLNGNILEDRSITADKIVANAITANEIATATITANEIAANTITSAEIKSGSIKAVDIDVANLFAQNITATGTISGLTLKGTEMELGENITFLNNGVYCGKIQTYATEGNSGYGLFGNDGIWLKSDECIDIISYKTLIQSNITEISSSNCTISGGVLYIAINDNIGIYAPTINIEGTLDATIIYENGTALSSKYQPKGSYVTTSSLSSSVTTGTIKSSETRLYIGCNNTTRIELFTNGSAYSLRPTSNGGCWLGSDNQRWGQIYTTKTVEVKSDRRVKHDINYDIRDEFENLIYNLKPTSFIYDYDDENIKQYGFIAQDVRDYLLENNKEIFGGISVNKNEDFNEDIEIGLDTDEQYVSYGMGYSQFIAPLVAVVQKQKQEIDELKQTVQSLIEEVQK